MMSFSGRAVPLVAVLTTVLLQLIAAWVLSIAAKALVSSILMMGLAVGAAIALNALRFALWGFVHRRYPLSHTYPMTALFFPLVLALSYWQGVNVGQFEVTGVALITLGVAMMAFSPGREGVGG